MNDLIPVNFLAPATLYQPGGIDAVLAEIAQRARSEASDDVSTAKSRAAIASLAHKVARSKTVLDDAGKQLVAEWKAKSAAVDAERKKARDALDALKSEIRAPLDAWEQAEAEAAAAKQRAEEETRAAAERAERERIEAERREAQEKLRAAEEALRLEREARLAAERAEAAARAEAERIEHARIEAERAAERAKAEAERVAELNRQREEASAKAEAERVERAKREAIEAERLARERAAQAVARREAILRDISDDIAQIMADTLSGTDCDALARKIAEGAIRHVAVPELGVALNSASALQAFFSTYAPWDELQPPLRERAEAIVAAIRAAKTEKALNQVMLAQRGTLNDIQLASETAHGWIMSEASRRLVEVVE